MAVERQNTCVMIAFGAARTAVTVDAHVPIRSDRDGRSASHPQEEQAQSDMLLEPGRYRGIARESGCLQKNRQKFADALQGFQAPCIEPGVLPGKSFGNKNSAPQPGVEPGSRAALFHPFFTR